jgi:hypothetical protein
MKHKWFIVGMNTGKKFKFYSEEMKIEKNMVILYWKSSDGSEIIDAVFSDWEYAYIDTSGRETTS